MPIENIFAIVDPLLSSEAVGIHDDTEVLFEACRHVSYKIAVARVTVWRSIIVSP